MLESKSLPLFDVYDGDELVQIICAHDEEEAQKFVVPEWYHLEARIEQRRKGESTNA